MTNDRPVTNRICAKSHNCGSDGIITGLFTEIIDILTLPMASRALSKKSTIPKKRKKTPNPVSPIPISADLNQSAWFSSLNCALYDF